MELNRKPNDYCRLAVLGKYLETPRTPDHHIQTLTLPLKNNLKAKTDSPLPLRVFASQKAIACIDQNNQAWLICAIFSQPVNISKLIRKEVKDIYLREKEMILQTKNSPILLNWGSPKILEPNRLMKLDTFKQHSNDSFFEAFIINGTSPSDLFYYCSVETINNTNKLFQVSSNLLVGYPYFDQWNFKVKVKGISIGQMHTLLWGVEGQLFSKGSKCIALGHRVDTGEHICSQYKAVMIKGFVQTAFAGTNYSLALVEGCIYEWGKKLEPNQINEQLIFEPRVLPFRYYDCQKKFINLKGNGDRFGALSSKGSLFLWGEDCKKFLSQNTVYPPEWKNTYVYEPVMQLGLTHSKILDFSLETDFVVVVATQLDSNICLKEEAAYWEEAIKKAQQKVAYFKQLKANNFEKTIPKQRRSSQDAEVLCISSRKLKTNESPGSDWREKSSLPLPFTRKHARKDSKESISKGNVTHKQRFSELEQSMLQEWTRKPRHRKAFAQCKIYTLPNETDRNKRLFSKSHQEKLAFYRSKKAEIEISYQEKAIERLREQDLQTREKARIQEEQTAMLSLQKQQLQESLATRLTLHYLVNALIAPLAQARQMKIKTFYGTLKSEKRDNHIKNVFGKARIIHCLKEMHKHQFIRYALLSSYFSRQVKKHRLNKLHLMRSLVITQLVKSSLSKQAEKRLAVICVKVKKVEKLMRWMRLVKQQSRRCLRYVWKSNLQAIYLDGEEQSMRTVDCQSLFQRRQLLNPMLKLDSYWRSTVAKTVNPSSDKKIDIRKTIQLDYLRDAEPQHGGDLLPFSTHAAQFRTQKKEFTLDLNSTVSSSSGWAKIERKVLKETIDRIIHRHLQTHSLDCRRYDLEMANFIRNNYEKISERRWRYILEYNQIKKTPAKEKKLKEVRRLLDLIGMTALLDPDCLPEKCRILQEAQMMGRAPHPPKSFLSFPVGEFKQEFAHYAEVLKRKAKLLKRSPIL